jgi:hypothetical protein
MNRALLLCGLAIWAAATIALRFAGQHFLPQPNSKGIFILFAISFPLMGWVVRRLCLHFGLPREEWLAGALSVALPTLVLDPFSSAFFPLVFPNMAPEVAGVFGGWMLWCCAGAFLGVTIPPAKQP